MRKPRPRSPLPAKTVRALAAPHDRERVAGMVASSPGARQQAAPPRPPLYRARLRKPRAPPVKSGSIPRARFIIAPAIAGTAKPSKGPICQKPKPRLRETGLIMARPALHRSRSALLAYVPEVGSSISYHAGVGRGGRRQMTRAKVGNRIIGTFRRPWLGVPRNAVSDQPARLQSRRDAGTSGVNRESAGVDEHYPHRARMTDLVYCSTTWMRPIIGRAFSAGVPSGAIVTLGSPLSLP